MLFKQIEYFIAVVQAGNYYLAGEKCNVSQSAISQQIIKLEQELDVKLLERHNRTFSLTPAGEHFYRKSLIILNDIEQMKKETVKIADKDNIALKIGYYIGYQGNKLSKAITLFSSMYNTLEVNVTTGSHEELYKSMENGSIDLAINDQRRAFSSLYHNVVLAQSKLYIEISSQSPFSKLDKIEITELKNTPCILLINKDGQKEEQKYYEDIIGIKGDYIFAESIQEARLKVLTGQGYMPIDVIDEVAIQDPSIVRIPLVRNGDSTSKTYCAFWRKDKSNNYIEAFATILKECFK